MNVFHYLFGNVHSALNEFSELAYDSYGTRIRAIPQVSKARANNQLFFHAHFT